MDDINDTLREIAERTADTYPEGEDRYNRELVIMSAMNEAIKAFREITDEKVAELVGEDLSRIYGVGKDNPAIKTELINGAVLGEGLVVAALYQTARVTPIGTYQQIRVVTKHGQEEPIGITSNMVQAEVIRDD